MRKQSLVVEEIASLNEVADGQRTRNAGASTSQTTAVSTTCDFGARDHLRRHADLRAGAAWFNTDEVLDTPAIIKSRAFTCPTL